MEGERWTLSSLHSGAMMTILGLSSKLKLTAPGLEHLMLTEEVVCVGGGGATLCVYTWGSSFIKVGVLLNNFQNLQYRIYSWPANFCSPPPHTQPGLESPAGVSIASNRHASPKHNNHDNWQGSLSTCPFCSLLLLIQETKTLLYSSKNTILH